MMEGEPMHALCQINLTGLPFRPPRLHDSELVPLAHQDTGSRIKPFPMRSRIIEEDFPCWEDIPIKLPDDLADNYYDLFENVSGLKLGGWPTLIQSEIYWAPWNEHPAAPEYVFQVDSEPKVHWNWGDRGVGYFGRGTAEGKEDEWACV